MGCGYGALPQLPALSRRALHFADLGAKPYTTSMAVSRRGMAVNTAASGYHILIVNTKPFH